MAMNGRVLVWDLPTRLFHWLLVLSLAGSWWTAEAGIEWMDWHFRLGYFAGGLILFRLIWGLVGTRHARFSSFLKGPIATAKYAATLFSRESKSTSGHNPLGGLVVLIILIAVGIQVGTGLFATDDIFTTGPFYPWVDDKTASELTSIHHLNFDILLIIAALHIAAVLFYLIWKRRNLIWPMIIGSKPTEEADEAIETLAFVRGLVIALIVAGAVAYVVSLAPEVVDEFY